MSQATNFSVPLIGPVTPAAMASRIDESFSALLSGHSGSGRPAYAVDGTVWMSTATAGQRKYYLYDGTADRLLFTVTSATGIVVNAGTAFSAYVNNGAANYTVVAADSGRTIDVDAAAANRTVTLPSAATVGVGFAVTVRKSDASFNTVTINRAGSDTINGATNYVLRLPSQAVTLMCVSASAWVVLAEANTVYRGSNANGEYVRFADGTQICTARVTSDGTANTTWTFPSSFTTSPDAVHAGAATNVGDIRYVSLVGIGNANSIGLQGRTATGAIAASGASMLVSAIGRWF